MKAKDIKPGTVYAYRRSQYQEFKPIVFLAPLDSEHLYTSAADRDATRFKPVPNAGKPSKGSWSMPATGYAAVSTATRRIGEDAAGADVFDGVTLDDFLLAESSTDYERGLEFVVVFNLGHVHGLYADIMAAEEEERARDKAARDEMDRRRRAAQKRATALVSALKSHGATAHWNDPEQPASLVLSFDEVDKLLALLNR
ncbi:hypothetical protein ACQEUU_37165 [Nonomuraea sp. CA-218870]|uniref:hypothetical protein n=1 Tax=Nonomuraea sp. CA-218870 TaxID=3239998 RepID=UPI003D916761